MNKQICICMNVSGNDIQKMNERYSELSIQEIVKILNIGKRCKTCLKSEEFKNLMGSFEN